MRDAFHHTASGSWGEQVHTFLDRMGLVLPDLPFAHPINVGDVSHAFLHEYDTVFADLDSDPRTATHHPRLTTFRRWFDVGKWGKRPRYVWFVVKRGTMDTFLRFKLGCHELGIELRRWQNRIPRDQRICQLCKDSLDDEHHMVFECASLTCVREQFSHLFRGHRVGPSMKRFFANKDQLALIKFVRECFRHREMQMTVR